MVGKARSAISTVCRVVKRPFHWFIAWRQAHTHQWLSKEIDREVRRLADLDLSVLPWVWRWLKQRLAPLGAITTGLVVIVVYAVLVVVLSRCVGPVGGKESNWESFGSDLWQVEAGVLGITLVVVVLLIQTRSADSRSDELFQFFVEDSAIIPIVVTGLVLVGLTGVPRFLGALLESQGTLVRGAYLASTVGFVVFLVLNVLVYLKVLKYISPEFLRHAKNVLLDRGLDDAITGVIRQMVGQAIFARYCAERGLYLTPYGDHRSDLYPVVSIAFGRVCDIDLRRLDEFAHHLQHGFVLQPRSEERHRAILRFELGSAVASANHVLARIHPEDRGSATEESIRQAYRLDAGFKQADELVRSALKLVKDEACTSLAEARPEAFRDTLESYRRFFDGLFHRWHAVAASLEVSGTPLAGLGAGPVRVAQHDIHDVMRRAIETGEPDSIGTAMYLPVRLLRLAVEFSETALFTDFAHITTGAYWLAVGRPHDGVRALIVDRCWRFLQEYTHFDLTPTLERDTTPSDMVTRLGTFVQLLVRAYNGLMKAAIDAADASSFEQFGAALDDLWTELGAGHRETQIDMIEWQLAHDQIKGQERIGLERRLARLVAVDRAHGEVTRLRMLCWFGLGAWILRQMRGGRLAPEPGMRMLALARDHLTDLGELASLYVTSLGEMPITLDWDNWVLQELPQGKAHFIDTDSWVRAFYCAQGFSLTPGVIAEEGTPIPPERRLEHELDALRKCCDLLREEHNGPGIVEEADLAKIDGFLELNRRAVGQSLREYDSWLIEQPLSGRRVQRYREEAWQEYRERAVIRTAFTHLGAVQSSDDDGKTAPSRLPCRAVHRVGKAFFVDDPVVDHFAFGDVSGMNLASMEDVILLRAMEGASPPHVISAPEAVIDGVDRARATMAAQSFVPNLAIIGSRAGSMLLRHLASDRRRWERHGESDGLPGYVGSLDGLPVLAVNASYPNLIVLSLPAFCVLQPDSPESAEVVSVRIEVIDEASARKLVETDPGFVTRLGATGAEDAVRRLQAQVEIIASRDIEFSVVNPGAAVLVVLEHPQEAGH